MDGIHNLGLFVLSGLLLNVTPGADTLYIVARGTTQGARAGAVAAMGIGTGCIVHTLAAALGLSAILATSATAFALVKWIGAAYLVYLGLALLAAGPTAGTGTPLQRASLGRVFVQGFVTNVLNPKVALFFLAFLPQFIDAGAPSKAAAFLALGAIFNVNGTLWNLLVAWSAGNLGRRLTARSSAARWLHRSVGALFIALGVRLAFAERG